MAVSPRERDAVRCDVARLGLRDASTRVVDVEKSLDRFETDVAIFDVRADLEIALRHLSYAAAACDRVGKALRS